MPRERDDESGQFTTQYPEEEFLTAILALENATTAAVAAEVGCSYDLAYTWLNLLAEAGKIHRTKIGSSLVWSIEE